MKLLDKLKDLFMDEVAEEDEFELEEEEKKEYKEPPKKDVLPKVMRDTIKKEEKKELDINTDDLLGGIKINNNAVNFDNENKKEVVNREPVKKFSFPIDIESEIPSRNSRKNNVNVLNVEKETPKKVSELYAKKEETWVKPKFKATPVISPVYGILDKNYKKEEVKEKSEDTVEMKRPSKKVDFETVRKKAFGNLADEIKDNLMCENCELYKEVKKISALKEDDLLYDMTVEEEKEVTIKKAYDDYEEFGVVYESKVVYEGKEIEKEEEKISDKLEETVEIKKPIVSDSKLMEEEVEKIPSREEKKKETRVDDDFFKLIDSMYKERVDD